MSSPQQPAATMANLPDDILSNIFIRLPAKLLAQMRSVSTHWNALLYQQSFNKTHLNRSVHDNVAILLVFYHGFSFDNKPFTAHPSRCPRLQTTNFIKLPVNILSKNVKNYVIGSVNGLICFSYQSQRTHIVHIWNPSLSALLTLPPYTIPSHVYDRIDIHLSFGFDPKNDDYKVVKLTSPLGPPKNEIRACAGMYHVAKEWLHVEVYSMRKGFWEIISQRFPSHITKIIDNDEVCVDGHDGYLHWLCYIDQELKQQTIVSFDLGEETFCEITLPYSIQDTTNHMKYLGVFARKLCVILCIRYDMCEVWVMDEYGVAKSWVKHRVFSVPTAPQYPPSTVAMSPHGFTLKNQFLFQSYGNRLALYDPVTDKLKSFEVSARVSMESRTKTVQYMDSLVWVTPSEHVIDVAKSPRSLQI